MFRKGLFALTAAGLLALLTAGSTLGAGVRTTNVAQLDDGTCGRNLQIGSDPTSSASATPDFLLWGDGGLSSYAMFIDGAPIGTFSSDGFANVCVTTSVPLADGTHTLTGNELGPHSTYTVTPYTFSVDTRPPAQPSTPVISGYSDSGLQGDHITKFRGVNFTGFSDPNVSIQLYSGQTLLGGAKADSVGAWSATTGSLADGSYVITAAGIDQAGNKSMLSLSCPLTVDGTAPTGSITNPTNGSIVSGTVPVTAAASDANGIWKVDFQVDGVTKSTTTVSPFTYSWNSTGVANGTHTLTAIVHDYPDNTTTSSISVNVSNGGATAPGAPALNSVTGGNGGATLNWSAPASNGGSAITGYKIYRGTASGGETLLTTLGSVTSFIDSGLTNGSTYYYKVSAVNAVGEGAQSNESSAIPAGVAGPPTLAAPTSSSGSVSLAWSAPASNGGTGITGYKVYRGTASGAETLLATVGSITSYTDTAVANGTTYYYKVTAVNSVGEGSLSNEVSATPQASATRPGAPTLNAATAGNASVALSWSAPASNGGSAITGYRIYRGTTSGGETLLASVGVVTTYADVTGLLNGTAYFYKVSAVNAVGESALSGELSAVPASAPGAPTLNAATGGTGSVTLSWSAPSTNGGAAITNYRIYRSTSSGTETFLTTVGNVTSYADTAVTAGTTYFYKVTASNSVGESAPSGEKSGAPTSSASVPGMPSLVAATGGNASVSLVWSAPASDGGSVITGYKIYRGTATGAETLLTTVANQTSYADLGVANGTTYYYKVSALNGIGESLLSGERSATPTAPATAPGAPTLNSASAGNANVVLSWTAPSSNGGSAVTGYRIYRSTASGAETFLASIGNVTTYTDAAALNGTTYYYKVSALNGVGESALSAERSAAPSAPSAVPGTPTLNPATAASTTVSLSWSAPASDGGSAVTGYKIYRGTASGGETLLTTLGNVTSWSDGGLANGTTYYYKVSAVNGVGEGGLSNEVSATPAAVPVPPTLATPGSGNGSVSLSWTAPGSNGGSAITGYRVYRGTAAGGEQFYTSLGNTTSYTDFGVTNGTTYYYRVTAVNAVGESASSNEQSATPATVPGAPTLTAATAGATNVSLSWNPPASNGGSAITGYRVYRSTASGAETLLTSVGAQTTYFDAAVVAGTAYYYKVTALSAIGQSVLSNELFATPTAAASVPAAPTLDSASAGNGNVVLSWSAPGSNGSAISGYKIYRGTTSGGETLLASVGNVTAYTDAAAANGTTYFYKVSAVNGVGEGSLSGERSATPAAAPDSPSLGASAGNASVTLSWSTPAANGSPITSYRVYRSTASGIETLLAVVGAQTSYTDFAVANGTTYYYVVSAVNGIGEGLPSNEGAATPATTPDAPSLDSASPGTGVTLTWTAPANAGGAAITGYDIYRSTASGGETFLTSIGNVTAYTDTTTSYGTTYYYEVSAVNAVGEGALSNELFATPVLLDSSAPSAPSNVKALLVGTSQVVLNWSAATDNVSVAGYRVYRDGVLVGSAATTHFLEGGLSAGTTHSFQVRAYDSVGNVSAASSTISARLASVATGTTGTLSGVVYNTSGKLLANVSVSLRLANGTLKSAKTNSSGVWKLSSVPAGTYVVSASLSGFRSTSFNMTCSGGRTVLAVTTLTA